MYYIVQIYYICTYTFLLLLTEKERYNSLNISIFFCYIVILDSLIYSMVPMSTYTYTYIHILCIHIYIYTYIRIHTYIIHTCIYMHIYSVGST